MSRIRAVGVGLLLSLGAVVIAFRGGRVQPLTPANPGLAVDAQPAVPTPVRDLLHRACFDCHSDVTEWPWYAHVPPASWLVAHDVREARGQLNFSRWLSYDPYDRADMLDKACDLVSKGRMPLWPYRVLHAEARLSEADVATLCAWTHEEADRLTKDGS